MANRAVIALVALFCAFAAQAAGRPLPAFEVVERIVPADPLAERETVWNHAGVTLTSMTYATRPGYRPLRLDLYRQSGVAQARPLVVYLHGGAWLFGNPRVGAAFKNFPRILAELAERGYVVAAIEYRLGGEAVLPAPTEDLGEALDFLRANAARLGLDPTRIALWGLSAGAQVAALSAVSCQTAPCVQGLVGWFGVYDLAAHLRQTNDVANTKRALGCGSSTCTDAALTASSPIDHVTARAPPMLLLHGLADTDVSSLQSQAFADRLRAAGNADVELILLPGLRHGFIGQDVMATQRGLQQALGATFDFFDRVLQRSATAVR
jgi:acetyl esterase/lipase